MLLLAATLAAAQTPIVQPGKPGEPARELTAEEAIDVAVTSYSPDDVRFMQDMIPHHQQAVDMAALVADRTNRSELTDAAGRINLSQQDEIEFMEKWLGDRGEPVPDPSDHAAMHTDHRMAGMATPKQMADLAAATGTEFDRLFLQMMITHHEGAVTMVEELLEQPGAAYDPVLFEFTSDITNDQTAEIERMHALLITLSDDPRAGLKAGFDDAGQAILNLVLLASLPRPPGFFDPENPAGLPPEQPPDDESEASPGTDEVAESDLAGAAGETGGTEGDGALDDEGTGEGEALAGDGEDAAGTDDEEDDNDDKDWERGPLLGFWNTDMAFRDDVLFAGSYHGFNIYRLAEDGSLNQLSSVVCPGGQGDVSVVGDLLIMSVEETRGRLDCGLQGIAEDVSGDRFRGIRIFDIGDLERPVQVGAVQTCRGSHTHSVVAADDEKIVVYNSGTSMIREEDELAGCIDATPGDYRTALFRIDVVEIPVEDPSRARIVHSPAVFADPEDGTLAGLWRGGDHGDHTQETRSTDQCHDITVFPARNIAAGACSGNGILFDISDPFNPTRIDAVVDKGFAYWHSATFNNDGTKVLYTDEWGGGSMPRCRAYDPLDWGANAIYDIVEGKLEFRSYYKMPAPQNEQENCVAHNGSVVPVPGRDIFVQSWYQGGISVMDFTDSTKPVEIAYFDRGPIDEEHLTAGGYWSSYWYHGKIYATELLRGLDVLALVPSDFLSENEIAAAVLADQGPEFNPQHQQSFDWPAEPVVARAYVDQLVRSDGLEEASRADLDAALDLASAALQQGAGDSALASRLDSLAKSVGTGAAGGIAMKRRTGLAETLGGIAARLRVSARAQPVGRAGE
ncbi:MAG: DUF305 domain-containing protein [Gammaproteobacteria bacterium]|nr:DUF305 domain-containing protein [Gammaproteobacteria bacterium]MDE0368236.1 DUF305 domain-containing protein [Gammaproteobacteria bacterium]